MFYLWRMFTAGTQPKSLSSPVFIIPYSSCSSRSVTVLKCPCFSFFFFFWKISVNIYLPGQHEFNDLTPLKNVLHFYASGSKSIELSENLMRTSLLQLNSCRKDYVDGKFSSKNTTEWNCLELRIGFICLNLSTLKNKWMKS